MSIYVHQKYNKPSLPPLSSLLRDQNYKLPSIDTLYDSKHSMPLPTPRAYSASTPLPGTEIKSPTDSISPTTPTFENKKPAAVKRKSEKAFAFISHSVATFPSQEPSIDNAPLARRKRRRTSPNELNILNQEFIVGSTPNKLRRIEIANKVSMTEKAVQIWFQNKRQSVRKQSTNDKEVTELPPTPEVSVNNSMISSMNTSMVNINTSMTSINNSVASSTPIKPILNKAHSFASPETTKLSPTFSKPILQSVQSSSNMKPVSSTPDSSFVDEDPSFFLQETKKKQPQLLNNANSSTMTFKLGKFKFHNDKENNIPKKNNKIQNLLNNAAEERRPLGEINTNLTKRSKVNEGVQSLLSLREGNWTK